MFSCCSGVDSGVITVSCPDFAIRMYLMLLNYLQRENVGAD